MDWAINFRKKERALEIRMDDHDTALLELAVDKGEGVFVDKFKSAYQRVAKKTKKKNIRCFPECCKSGHRGGGVCIFNIILLIFEFIFNFQFLFFTFFKFLYFHFSLNFDFV